MQTGLRHPVAHGQRTGTFTVLAAVLLSLRCATPPLCEPEFPLGKSSTVELVEPWTSAGRYAYRAGIVGDNLPSCAGRDGLAAAVKVTVTPSRSVTSAGDGGCATTYGTHGPVAGVEFIGASSAGPGAAGEFFTSASQVNLAGCAGRYIIGLVRVDSGAFAGLPGDKPLPELLLTRTFYPETADAGSTCSACRDAFVTF